MNIPSDLQQRADQLHLAMHVHSNGMMAGLFDGQSKQPLWLSETFIATWELHNRVMEWGWNQPVFRKITLSRSPLQWTLCPPYLLDPSNIGGWLHQSNENNVRAIPIPGQNMILIEESESLYPMVHGLFPHLQEFSTVEFLLHYHLSTPANQDRLLVVTEAEITRIFAHQQGKFLLANQYACKEPEDTLYFASAIVQQYELSNETPIILAGQNANIELIRLFEPYYTQVKAWTAPFGLKMPKGQVDAHWHSILLHTLCAS